MNKRALIYDALLLLHVDMKETEMTDVIFEMPAYINHPDMNGRIYSIDCMKKAIKNYIYKPVIVRRDGADVVIGFIEKCSLNLNNDKIVVSAKITNKGDMDYVACDIANAIIPHISNYINGM